MAKPHLELKATSFTLSVLHVNHVDLDLITAELEKKLAQAPQFFIGAPMVVNLSAVADHDLDLVGLKQLFVSRNLIIVGITDASKPLAELAKANGIAVLKSGKQAPELPVPQRETKIIKQNVRSGQQIYAKNGDLIVFGAVGNGAEVIADGSIHIYGTLRGKAMAGASGDTESVVIASALDAELVSIAGQYWLAEHFEQHKIEKRGCVRLVGQSLTVESLP